MVLIENSIFFEQYLDFILGDFGNLYSPMEWLEVDMALSKTEIVLLLILSREKEMKISEISNRLSTPLSTTTSLVDRLEQKKMVLRSRSLKDRRVVIVTLTDRGKQFAKEITGKMEAMMQAMVQKITANLTAEEVDFLKKIFIKITGR